MQVKIAHLQPQLASYQHQKQFLMLEHQTLDSQMVALEQETLLKDGNVTFVLLSISLSCCIVDFVNV